MRNIVLAISGSMRKRSFTEKMLDLCIEGMGKDLEVHKFYPHKMKIGPCTGCWSCWGKKRPGVCVQKDDFEQILDVYKRADYLLIAAPLYFFSLPATVKIVLERFFIILEPAMTESNKGGSTHLMRFGRHPKAVLISSCGYPEIENFSLLRQHFHLVCEHINWRWSGEILISAAGAANVPKLFDNKYSLIRKAGAELIKGEISKEITDAIAEPVMPAGDYRRFTTLFLEGGMMAKAKIIVSLAIKAMRSSDKSQFT